MIAARGSRPPAFRRPRARRRAWRSRRAAAAAGCAGFSRARKVRVCRAACGESSRSTTSKVCVGRARERRLVARRLERREVILRHVDDDLGLAVVGDRDDRLAFGDDLADLEAHARSRRRCDARSTVYFRRLRASSSFFASASAVAFAVCAALLCACSSSDALTEPSALRRSRRWRSDSACRACAVGGDELLPRGLLGEPVVGVVEHGDHVALADRLAHVDFALDDLAADAKSLVDLVARLHGADVAVRFAAPCRSGARRCGRRAARSAAGFCGAAGQERGERDGEQRRGGRSFHGGSSDR